MKAAVDSRQANLERRCNENDFDVFFCDCGRFVDSRTETFYSDADGWWYCSNCGPGYATFKVQDGEMYDPDGEILNGADDAR